MIIANGMVFHKGRFEKKDIQIEDGRFAGIAEPGGLKPDTECLDASGRYILPGLVDVHTHGRMGEDFSALTEESLQKLLCSYAACGVTSVLATTMTNEPEQVEQSLEVIGLYRKKLQKTRGFREMKGLAATLAGIHMEGPFLGAEKKGAHDARYLKELDWNWLKQMQEVSGGSIRLITIDPALSGAEAFTGKCVENGIKVSLGHTACEYETAVKAVQAGADHVTHVCNAMNPLHHREPGLVGAALDMGMYTELICDGIHVHPALVRLLFAAHPEQMVLVSDSIAAAGCPDGIYSSGGLKIRMENKKAVLEDGTIAGSAISLFDAMVNAIKYGVPAEAAVNSATYLPAKSVGLEETAGSIAVGRKADFLMVDKDWQLERVFIEGLQPMEGCFCFQRT